MHQVSGLNDVPLDSLGLSVRAYNCLRRVKINSLGQIAAMSDSDLLSVPNLGEKTLKEIRTKLTEYLNRHPELEQSISSESQSPELLPVDLPPVAKRSIQVLDLSIRSYNALMRRDIVTIGQLAQMPPERVSVLKGVGKKICDEIFEKLSIYLEVHPLPEQSPCLGSSSTELVHEEPETPEVSQIESLAQEIPASGKTVIELLDLSTRTFNALGRANVKTIEQLAHMSGEQLLDIRNIGPKAVTEVKEKLARYLAEPEVPLVDPALLNRASLIPLDDISIDRLDLPIQWLDQLQRREIRSIGELTRQPGYIFNEDSLVREYLTNYLTWLVEQDKDVWIEESVGSGISPVCRSILAETPLDDLFEQWLNTIAHKRSQPLARCKNLDRDQKIVCDRYGVNGDRLTLEEIGHLVSITRERVRQIERRALNRLGNPASLKIIHPFVVFLENLFREAGGLMREMEINQRLLTELKVESVEPVGIAHLVFDVCDNFEWISEAQVWGLTDFPLCQVPNINRQLSYVLEEAYAPLPYDTVLNRFRETRFFKDQSDELDDAFINSCLRTHPKIEVDGSGMCGLQKWAKRKFDEVVLALRRIGRPAHYSRIAEQANALLPPDQKTAPHNIHSILNRYPNVFVNLGRGKYWLQSHLREDVDAESQINFGDLFGTQLDHWQRDWEHRQDESEIDAHNEVDKIRNVGLDFFRD